MKISFQIDDEIKLDLIKNYQEFDKNFNLNVSETNMLIFVYSMAVLHEFGLVQEDDSTLTGKGFDVGKDLFDMGYRLLDNEIDLYLNDKNVFSFDMGGEEMEAMKLLVKRLHQLGYDEMKAEVQKFKEII